MPSLDLELAEYYALASSDKTALEANWEKWLRTIFPQHTKRRFADFHREFWEHIWSIQPGIKPRPYFAIWFRAAAKSTSGEIAAVALGARGRRRYGLYLCSRQAQANDHLMSIRKMIESSRLGQFYPLMARPKISRVGKNPAQQGWNRARLWTDQGWIMDAIGLDVAIRGAKLEDQRPDFLLIDDIDEQDDSPQIVEAKIKHLTQKILPAGNLADFAVIGLQNLVHRHSIFAQIESGKADFLQDRIISTGSAVPMVEHAQTIKHEGKHVLIGGRPRWPAMSLSECASALKEWGYRTWQIEGQQKVDLPYEGALFGAFDRKMHVITRSEFRAVYGHRGLIPSKGYCYCALDAGTTVKHPWAMLWAWRPAERMPHTDCIFFYREIVRPRFPATDDVEIVAPLQIGKEIQDVESLNSEEMQWRIGSHEAALTRNSFQVDLADIPGYHGMYFDPIKTNEKGLGILSIQDLLFIDETLPHPFRRDPRTGYPLIGRPRLFLVADDDQGEMYYDGKDELQAAPERDEQGFARTCWEFPIYKHRENVSGQETEQLPKIDDDAMDAMIALMARVRTAIQPLTQEERILLRQTQAMQHLSDHPMAQMTAQYQLDRDITTGKIDSLGSGKIRYGLGASDGYDSWDEEDY